MLKSNVATLQSTPPETAFPALPPLDIAAIAARAGDASAKLLGDIAGGRYVRPEPSAPRFDYKTEILRRAATAIKRFLTEHEARFFWEGHARPVEDPAGWRFVAAGEKHFSFLIFQDAWGDAIGANSKEAFESALASSGILATEETIGYFPTINAVKTHSVSRPIVTRQIAGAARRGYVIGETALDLVSIERANPEEEARRAIAQVREFILKHGARFRPLDADAAEMPPTPNLAGWRSGVGEAAEWWILPTTWRAEVCIGALDPIGAARMCADAGHLVRGSDGLQSVKKVSANTPRRVYAIAASIFAGVGNAL
jgi:hypothetical protein